MSNSNSRFEIITADWRLSFQRRVGENVGSNRGALPLHRLSADGDPLRVLVPLPEREALWIAWMLNPGVTVSGADASGTAVRIAPVKQSRERWSLFAADALEHADGLRGLDAGTLAPTSAREAIGQDHLRFSVRGGSGETFATVGIVVATPALYAELSGQPAPAPSAQSDAYTGWRLP